MRKRLDLTVIGTAVNAALRLETLTKAQKRTVLLSKAFIDMAKFKSDLETSSFPASRAQRALGLYAFREDR